MARGLRFRCRPGCTECCLRPGFVYLTEADLARAAACVGLAPADFERQHCYRTPNRLRLRVPRGARCRFLTADGCRIHPAKPTQCRTFPFWPELLDSRREWKAAARYCPGIDDGPLIRIEIAEEQAREMRAAYPAWYGGSTRASGS
jgi:Fe-S-cluster containining protein